MGKFSLIFASGLGLGYLPWASGTFGSLWGILFFYWWSSLNIWYFSFSLLAMCLLSIPFVHFAEKQLASHDSSVIVLDEILGYLVAVWGMPFNFWTVALAFGLFRLFDIWKPFPISYLDKKVGGAFGVIADDLLAGVFANLILWCVQLFVLR